MTLKRQIPKKTNKSLSTNKPQTIIKLFFFYMKKIVLVQLGEWNIFLTREEISFCRYLFLANSKWS